MASGFVIGYSIGGLFASYLQKDLGLSPGLVGLADHRAELIVRLSGFFWGWVSDRVGRRWAMILPAIIGFTVTPLYLFTVDYTMMMVFLDSRACSPPVDSDRTRATSPNASRPRCVQRQAACYHRGRCSPV